VTRATPRRPSAALVISILALFASLTGVGWAGLALDKNSVRSKTIKNGQVRSIDVADDTKSTALTGEDISNAGGGTLADADLAADSVGSSELAPASAGSSELGAGSVGSSELAPNSVGSSDVIANSLTGADVNESTLEGTPRRFRRAMPDTTSTVRILDLGGLRVDAGCSSAEELTLIASSAVDNAVFQINAVNDANTPLTIAAPDFEANDTRNLHAALASGDSMAAGTFTYTTTGGSVVSGSVVLGQGYPFDDGAADCIVAGQAWRSA
jgi:hypothetical protein